MLRICLVCCAIFTSCLPLQAGWWDNVTGYFKRSEARPPSIKILIMHDVPKVLIEVKGEYSLYDPYDSSKGSTAEEESHISTRYIGKKRFMETLSDGLKWGEIFPRRHQLHIKPDKPDSIILVDNREYAGSIYVYDIGGSISIVNVLPIEEYVISIISAYQHLQLEPETLAALAIVIRTNAYEQSINPKNTKGIWSVDAQQVGYDGRAHSSDTIYPAAHVTKGMIMSRTGIYEGRPTSFIAQFGDHLLGGYSKKAQISTISIDEANRMAQNGEHAAQILLKAFPGMTIMMIPG